MICFTVYEIVQMSFCFTSIKHVFKCFIKAIFTIMYALKGLIINILRLL